MSRDTIGDFLTIIRNGVMASKRSVVAPYSRMSFELATLLKQEGFIRNVSVVIPADSAFQHLAIELKYVDGEAVVHEIKRCSRPGRRFYAGTSAIKPVIGGLGVSLLTTHKGVMTHKKAKELGVGGEIICTVW